MAECAQTCDLQSLRGVQYHLWKYHCNTSTSQICTLWRWQHGHTNIISPMSNVSVIHDPSVHCNLSGRYTENSHSTRLPDLAINYRFRQCLLPLTSILFAIAQQQDHSPLPSGVIWEGIYITQFMSPQLGAQCRTPYHRYIKMGPIKLPLHHLDDFCSVPDDWTSTEHHFILLPPFGR